MRLAVAGSPAYFKENSIPKHPQDLKTIPASASDLPAVSTAGSLRRPEIARRQPSRTRIVRRSRPGHPGRAGGSGNRDIDGRKPHHAAQQRTLGSDPAGLVSLVSRVLPLLPKPTEPISSSSGFDPNPPRFSRSSISNEKRRSRHTRFTPAGVLNRISRTSKPRQRTALSKTRRTDLFPLGLSQASISSRILIAIPSGSAACVIGRPTTSIDAPRRSASPGPATLR